MKKPPIYPTLLGSFLFFPLVAYAMLPQGGQSSIQNTSHQSTSISVAQEKNDDQKEKEKDIEQNNAGLAWLNKKKKITDLCKMYDVADETAACLISQGTCGIPLDIRKKYTPQKFAKTSLAQIVWDKKGLSSLDKEKAYTSLELFKISEAHYGKKFPDNWHRGLGGRSEAKGRKMVADEDAANKAIAFKQWKEEDKITQANKQKSLEAQQSLLKEQRKNLRLEQKKQKNQQKGALKLLEAQNEEKAQDRLHELQRIDMLNSRKFLYPLLVVGTVIIACYLLKKSIDWYFKKPLPDVILDTNIRTGIKAWLPFTAPPPAPTTLFFNPAFETKIATIKNRIKKAAAHPGKYHFPNMVFLGPPGTGKSSLLKDIAAHCGVKYIKVTGSSFLQMTDEKAIEAAHKIIKIAKESKVPCLICLEECEDLFGVRTQGGGVDNKILRVFLDAFPEAENKQCAFIIVTNLRDWLDDALDTRVFDNYWIEFTPPQGPISLAILLYHLKVEALRLGLATSFLEDTKSSVDLAPLQGYSGRELKSLAIHVAREIDDSEQKEVTIAEINRIISSIKQ